MVAATSMLQIGLALLVSGKRLGAWHIGQHRKRKRVVSCLYFFSIRFDSTIRSTFVFSHNNSLTAAALAAAQAKKKPKAAKQANTSQPAVAGAR